MTTSADLLFENDRTTFPVQKSNVDFVVRRVEELLKAGWTHKTIFNAHWEKFLYLIEPVSTYNSGIAVRVMDLLVTSPATLQALRALYLPGHYKYYQTWIEFIIQAGNLTNLTLAYHVARDNQGDSIDIDHDLIYALQFGPLSMVKFTLMTYLVDGDDCTSHDIKNLRETAKSSKRDNCPKVNFLDRFEKEVGCFSDMIKNKNSPDQDKEQEREADLRCDKASRIFRAWFEVEIDSIPGEYTMKSIQATVDNELTIPLAKHIYTPEKFKADGEKVTSNALFSC